LEEAEKLDRKGVLHVGIVPRVLVLPYGLMEEREDLAHGVLGRLNAGALIKEMLNRFALVFTLADGAVYLRIDVAFSEHFASGGGMICI
jgi:hypothetical protein